MSQSFHNVDSHLSKSRHDFGGCISPRSRRGSVNHKVPPGATCHRLNKMSMYQKAVREADFKHKMNLRRNISIFEQSSLNQKVDLNEQSFHANSPR